MILKCCVIDDEPLARQLIAGYVDRTPFLELAGSFASAQEAVKPLLEGGIDLVFLDIHMPQLNGLELARIIPPSCMVIFTTAYDRYALDGYKVNALDYLLKPVAYEEFVTAASKALTRAGQIRQSSTASSKEYIIVRSDARLVQIPLAHITYIEGLKDYVKIYLDNEPRCIMTLMSMRTLEQNLPAETFMRVHRSFIVNTAQIKVIERNRVVFGNTYIPVGDTYRQAFLDFIESRTLLSGRDD